MDGNDLHVDVQTMLRFFKRLGVRGSKLKRDHAQSKDMSFCRSTL